MRFCDGTMLIWIQQFNLKKVAGPLAVTLALTLLCGCQTDKKDKNTSILRVHIEVTVPTATSQSVSVLRATPVLVTVQKDAVLTEANIIAAKLLDTPGGFAVQVKFDEDTGAWILQQYSAANPGKHFAIYGQWSDKATDGRWLAAPLITRRIPDGVLSFSVDATREEAQRLVNGLNNYAKKSRGITPKAFK